MFKNIINLLRDKNIKFDIGLKYDEFSKNRRNL